MTVVLHLKEMRPFSTSVSVEVSGHPQPTKADVELTSRDDLMLCKITETSKNTGALIGEACGVIVKELCKQLDIRIESIFCILYVLEDSYPYCVIRDEEYILQDFHRDGSLAAYEYINSDTVSRFEHMFSGNDEFQPEALKMSILTRKQLKHGL